MKKWPEFPLRSSVDLRGLGSDRQLEVAARVE